MSQKLVSSVIFNGAHFAFVRLVFSMSSLVVSAVTDGSELLFAVATEVRFLAGVCAHVYQKISFFGENFSAPFNLAQEGILTTVS